MCSELIILRDNNNELEARNAKKVFGKIGHIAGGIFKTALHFLREDEPELMAREFADEDLYARDFDEALYAREFDDELYARELEERNAKKVFGKIGHIAGGIFKTALHFLREDDPLLARSIEENPILARALEDHVTEMFARSLENGGELSAREMDELEARNAKKVFGKIGHIAGGIFKTALHFLREDSPELYAREFLDEDLYAREMDELEARNAKKVFSKIGHIAGGIFKTALHFLREDSPELYAREFDDGMLFERAMEIDELD